MKKFRSVLSILFALLIAASSVPVAFSENFETAFVNGDSEGIYDGIYYSVDSESSFVYASDKLYTYREYYTDYAVGKLALSNGKIYVTKGNELRGIDIKYKSDSLVLTADDDITSFSYWYGRFYYLSSGNVYSANFRGNDEETVVKGKNITSMWFDEDGVLSYMTDEEFIYSLNLETGEESSEVNFRSSFSEYIPVYTNVDPEDGTTPCALTLTDLRSKFPDGKYWNHVGSSSNNENGYTSTACPSHSDTSTCNCFSQWSSWQCMGFAYKCAWDTTGSNAHYWNTYTNSSALDSVKVGDCIRYRNDGHTVFVIGVSGSSVTVAECNWGGNCIINWDRTISISTLKSTFTWLRTTSTIVIQGDGDSGDVNYTLKLDANGGSCSTSSMQVKSGKQYGTLPEPTRTGYTFAGWFTESSGGSQVTSSTVCSGNATIYAHWNEITYTVSYNANAGSDTVKYVPDSQTKYYFSNLTLDIDTTPKRNYYEFQNWNTDSSGNGTAYTRSNKTYKTNADVTLYAIWKGNDYTINFSPNGGNCDTSNKKVSYGSAIGSLPTPTKSDSDFQGWFTRIDGGTQVTESYVMDNDGMTLYAHWSKKQYTITYDSNGGGSVPSSQTKNWGDGIYLSSETPSRTGFDFVEYNTSSDGSGTRYVPGQYYSEDSSIVLYAIWDRNKYPVTYDSNGGTGSIESAYKYYDIPLEVSSAVPSKIGCDFVEWNTSPDGKGTGYPIGSSYTGNTAVTLYAVWDVAKYRITYDANGGPEAPKQQIKIYQQSITLDSSVPSRTGFDFVNWNTRADGSGTTYNPGEIYTDDAHLTLYAQWYRHRFPVTFDANSGTGAPESQVKYYDITLTLPSVIPSKTGYTFTGWNTKADGSGTTYSAGGAYTADTESAVVLYAQWEANKYTITFYAMGGSCDTSSKTVTYDGKYGTLPAASKAGYTFEGWNTSSSGGSRITADSTVRITSNTVLYADFEPITYAVTFNSNGGTCSTQSKGVKYNTEYGELPAAERNGYTFTGWFTSPEEENQVTSSSIMKTIGGTTLYAGWLPVRYTVTLNAEGGKTDTQAVFVSYNTKYDSLPTPERKGYIFTGWYTSPDGGTKVTSDTVCTRSADHTLYAAYSLNSYKIKFDCVSDTVKASYGNKVGTLPTPTKSGYTFCGWYTDSGESVTSDTDFTYDEDITLTAKFIANPTSSMTAVFVADGKIVSTASISSDYTVDEPAVPSKSGFTGRWENYSLTSGKAVINAVYTPITYKVDWVTSEKTVTENYNYGDVLTIPESLRNSGSVISVSDSDIPETMPAGDIIVNLSLVPVIYCAEFISEGKSVAKVPYSKDTVSIKEPAVPEKSGYAGIWQSYTLTEGGTNIFAVYTPVTYQMVFEADGVKVASVDYTVETDEIIAPSVPSKTGYTGKWGSWSYPAGGCTVKAVYTPNTYTITFMGNGSVAGKVDYKYGADSVTEPAVPEKTGYIGSWPQYTLGASNQTVNAVYTPITYYATFVADGLTVKVVPFNVTYTSLEEPEVPVGDAVTAKWESYSIGAHNMTINAVYTYSNVKISGYRSSRTEDYKTTVTFSATVDRTVANAAIHWYVSSNGTDFTDATPEGKANYIVRNATQTYYIKAVYVRNGKVIAESETEQVIIKTDFFSKIVAFFRGLFSRLPIVNQ